MPIYNYYQQYDLDARGSPQDFHIALVGTATDPKQSQSLLKLRRSLNKDRSVYLASLEIDLTARN
jgi:hypothetical protein